MSLYIGNLSHSVSQEDISTVFKEYGTVQRVTIPMDRETGRPRGFAFVEMSSEAEEEAAVEALDGAEWMGRELRVNKARPRQQARGSSWGGSVGGGSGSYYASSRQNAETQPSSSSDRNLNVDDISSIPPFDGYLSQKASQKDTAYNIVLTGDLKEIRKEDLQILVYQLRKLSKDSSLNIVDIINGSIVVKLDGSEEGFRILLNLWESGQLKTLSGLPIESIFLEIDSIEDLDSSLSQSLKDSNARSGSYLDRSVNNVNVYNNSSVQQVAQTSSGELIGVKKDMSENYTNNFQDSNVANMANVVKENGRQQANQNINITGKDSLILEAVSEVRAILRRFEHRASSANIEEKIEFLSEETQPRYRDRLIKALKDGGEAAIEELFESSYFNVVKAAIKGWMSS